MIAPALWLERLWHDVRHAGRMFAKHPAFTAIAVISIAFGTGANVAMFSTADALLLRPLPVPRPGDVLTVGSRSRRGLFVRNVASYPDYLDIRARSRSFAGLAASTSLPVSISAHPPAPPQVKFISLVSHDFFRVLGVQPYLGRAIVPREESDEGYEQVAVLGYGFWQQEFGSDPAVLGRKVRISGIDCTIVGVAPEAFTGLSTIFRDAAFVPLGMWPRLTREGAGSPGNPLEARAYRNLTIHGRLAPGVTMAEAQAELDVIGADLERTFPETNTDQPLIAQTELEVRLERNPLDAGLVILLSTLSIAVLGVACANVAGLLSSRGPHRARAIALRLAIGAGRPRIVRQLITESVAIALAGAAGGLGVGWAGIVLIRQMEYPTEVISAPPIQLDERAMLFSLVLAVASALLFGLGPAIQTTRVNLVSSLKTTDTSSTRRQRLTGRATLVALQVALSLVLLTISVFAYQVFRREFSQGPGFLTTNIAKARIDVTHTTYRDGDFVRFFERAAADARRLGDVRSAALTAEMPLFGFEIAAIVPEGFNLPAGQTSVVSYGNVVDEEFFKTLGIPVVAGRAFLATDTADRPRVAIVNDALARHYWPAGAIGRRFRLGDADGPWVEIVGIAKTTKYMYPAEPPQDMVYFPFRQQPRGNMTLLVRTDGESAALLTPLRDLVRRLDADVPVYEVQTMERFYEARVTSIFSVILRMIGGIGLMGMTLTMVGLYGLVSFAVSRRTREIGIRIAIGASYQRVLGMVLREGLVPACAGLVIGLALSAVTMRLLPTVVPVTHQYDPLTHLLVVPLLIVVTVFAAFVPARRAARVDPTAALRCE